MGVSSALRVFRHGGRRAGESKSAFTARPWHPSHLNASAPEGNNAVGTGRTHSAASMRNLRLLDLVCSPVLKLIENQ